MKNKYSSINIAMMSIQYKRENNTRPSFIMCDVETYFDILNSKLFNIVVSDNGNITVDGLIIKVDNDTKGIYLK